MLAAWMRRVGNWWTSGKRRPRPATPDARWRPRLEGFEDRLLLATTLTVGANLNITKSTDNEAETSIAMNPTNTSDLFAIDTATYVGRYSTDAGQTWNVSDMSAFTLGNARDTQAVWDQFGNLFVTLFGPGAVIEVGVSSNAGVSFSNVQSIANTAAVSTDQPTLAVGPSGTAAHPGAVWVSWEQGNMIQAAGAPVDGLGMVGAFGTTETAPGSANGNFGSASVGPAGQLLVNYQSPVAGEGPSTIFTNLDPDGLGAAGFNAAITAHDTNVGGFATVPVQPGRLIDAEANLAYDDSGGVHNGRVYMVYTDRSNVPAPANANTDIFVIFSDNDGTTWSTPVRVNDDPSNGTSGATQFLPAIAVDQSTGNLAVSWYDTRNSTTATTRDTYASVSVDGGATFVPNVKLSAGISDPTVAAVGSFNSGDLDLMTFSHGVFYRSWSDNSNSTADNPAGVLSAFDIYTAQVTVTTSGGGGGGGGGGNIAPGNLRLAVGADAGGGPEVKVYNAATTALLFDFFPYRIGFTGGVRTAVADVNGDGVQDIITAPGTTGGPDIRVYDGTTGALLTEFMAYDPRFTGGVYVAAADFDKDGHADIVTAPDVNGGPDVRVFSGADGTMLRELMAYNPGFRGGVRVAAGDINGDGTPDIITGAGPGGGPHVQVFSGFDGSRLMSFFPYAIDFHGGVYVAAGSLGGSADDIVTGAGPGGGPHVEVFDGNGVLVRSFFADAAGSLFSGDTPSVHAGVRVATADLNGDGTAEILTTFGAGHAPDLRVFDANTQALLTDLLVFSPAFTGGVYIGG